MTFNSWERVGGRHINSFTGEDISHREYLKRGFKSTSYGIDHIKTKSGYEEKFKSQNHASSKTISHTGTFKASSVNSIENAIRRLPTTFKGSTGFYARLIKGGQVVSTQVFGKDSLSEITKQLVANLSLYGMESSPDEEVYLELIARVLM